MEKDNFEVRLRHIVSSADQGNPAAGNRERVWGNIELQGRPKKKWYAIAIVATFLMFAARLISINQTPDVQPEVAYKAKISAPVIKKQEIKQDPILLPAVGNESIRLIKREIPIDTIKPIKTEVENGVEKAIVEPVVLAVVPIASESKVANSPIEQPLVIEFKRGGLTEEKAMADVQNPIEKKRARLKLSFKRQNEQ